MKDKFFCFLKEVYKSMSNKTAEVINAVKNAVIEISNNKFEKIMTIYSVNDLRLMRSDNLIVRGAAIAGVGMAIGGSLIAKGVLMRKEI